MPEEVSEKKKVSKWKLAARMLAVLALLAYIVFMFFKEKTWVNDTPCERLVVCIKDSARAAFVSKEDVKKILVSNKVNPIGVPMNKVSLLNIEKKLAKHVFILDAQCYKTADNAVHIEIEQRLPVVRVMSNDGDNYYIDAKGEKIARISYPADVIVATGNINTKYAKKYLAPIGVMLQEDEFWNGQMEQINVLKDGSMEMVSRVGNHIVYFGVPENMPSKLDKLKHFYKDVLCQVGWNKYKQISLEYNNQIICTKID